MIREVIGLAGIVYICIIIIQILERASIAIQALFIICVTLIGTIFYFSRNEWKLHLIEISALSVSIFIFALYGIMKFGGLI